MKINNKIIYLLLLLILSNGVRSQNNNLVQEFQSPVSKESLPWTFWYWMYGAVSKQGITADLESMKKIGLGGAYLMPIKGPADNKLFEYSPAYDQLTPEWWEMVGFSMEESDRLGLKLGMHVCDGFALAGGPWITPETSMQKVVWADTIVNGGKIKNLLVPELENYEGYSKDIALFAVPVSKSYSQDIKIPVVTSNTEDRSPRFLADPFLDDTFRSNDPCWIQYTYDSPIVCRKITVEPGGNNFQAQRLSVYTSDDGVDFRLVKQLTPFRQGWQNTGVGFTFSLPETKSKYFRFYWTPEGTEPGAEDLDAAKWRPNLKIKSIMLSEDATIENIEGKNGSMWRVSERMSSDELPNENCVSFDNIIRIPISDIKEGRLTTKLPRGKWKLVRVGHTSTGYVNATGGGGRGLECDKFTAETVRFQFDNWLGAAFEKTDPVLARRVLKYMHIESWECGSQNWSETFPAEFKKRRGYDLMPYMLVYTGIPIDSVEQTENILQDIRETILELVVDVFYDTLYKFSREYDCEISAENVSPTMISDGMMHYKKVDRPMGEFWLQSPTHDKINDMMDAISGAHIYGKNIVQAEGFTQLRTMWNENPRMVKTLLDRHFAMGVNKLFHHVFAHDPYVDKFPSMTLDGIGFAFQRGQTWWDYGNAWIDYIARCQTLLQYGKPVIDIAVFNGEEAPRRSVLPERLVGSLPGLFGKEKVEEEAKRMANVDQPLRVMPVGVTHSANITDASQWIDALNGYNYDSFNKDVLLNMSSVRDGKMVLDGGMEYQVVVFPLSYSLSPNAELMSYEVLKAIKELQDRGVTVLLGDKPISDRSFKKTFSESDYKELSNNVWSASSDCVLPYTDADLNRFGLERDVELFGQRDIAWTHRAGDGVDIYFVSNQIEEQVKFDVSFRVSGMQPELWNPVTGEIINLSEFEMSDTRTKMSLDMYPNQSLFVVFRNKVSDSISTSVLEEQIPVNVKEWNVEFEKDPSLKLTVDNLFDWSESDDKRIKYYSGTASYKTSFDFEQKGNFSKVSLDLGDVKDIAEVIVNGVNCGTIWTFPNRIDISKSVKDGLNQLEVRVVNGWTNRIKGVNEEEIVDSSIWTNTPYWAKDIPLQKSGLKGPLSIILSN